MSEGNDVWQWRVLGSTARGTAHVRAGLPNQDALRSWTFDSGPGSRAILAVADGHGSTKCFRSDVGARLAVETAIDTTQGFLNRQEDNSHLSLVRYTVEERLPRELVHRWTRAVEADMAEDPLRLEEFETLEQISGDSARQTVEGHPLLAYGSTLLLAVATSAFVAYLQLGDGDILTVSDDGAVERPLPLDPRLFANETTSLSFSNAWQEFRVHFQALSGSAPALILLSTDGYANSFRDDTGFLQVGSDIHRMLRLHGETRVGAGMESWLTKASEAGSGDDITLGIVYRSDVLPAAGPDDESRREVTQSASEVEGASAVERT